MLTLKNIGVFAIVVGCFAILYPRFIHPITLRVFGLQKTPETKDESKFKSPNMVGDPRLQASRPEMRSGRPPGMRAAAEMERERAQQGSGRGMMGVVLPMYAVGIVLYLIYTLVKVFNKRGGEERKSDLLNDYMGTDPNSMYETTAPLDSKSSMVDFLKNQKNNELEKLLVRADEKNISSEEMRSLQKRLEETEAQMTSILKAMQTVSSKVDDVASVNPDLQDMLATELSKSASADVSSNQKTPQHDAGEKCTKSTDSSPDLDSFEFVNRKKGSNSDTSNNTDNDLSPSLSSEIENIGAADVTETKMKESESTESCDKDSNSVVPESEQDENNIGNEAEGIIEEIIPGDKTEAESSMRHRQVDSQSNN